MNSSKWLTREVLGWAFYDFANSAFATTVLAVIFNVYFVQVVVGPAGAVVFGRVIPGESLWGYSIALSTLFTFFLSPLLGAVCDNYRVKKSLLGVTCGLGAISTALLFFALPGRYIYASCLFISSNIGFAVSSSIYNAFLNDISDPDVVGRVSGFGWALGYVGGGLCLAINLLIIKFPGAFGLSAGGFMPMRASIAVSGLWWLLFSLPVFLWVKEKELNKNKINFIEAFAAAFTSIKQTVRHIKGQYELIKFMIAYLIYNDGIETVIVMASIFAAKVLNMNQGSIILCFLMIQGTAFIGSLIFGWFADKVGHKKSILASLIVYIGVIIWASAFIKTQREFWVLGVFVGMVLGGSQAVSRSMFSLMIPEDKSGEYFGFAALAGKLATVFGPFLFALTSQLWGLRPAVASLLIFFVVGGLLLWRVKEPKNQK